MAQRGKSEPLSISAKYFYSVNSEQPVTNNLFSPNIFGKEAFLAMISSVTLFIYWRRDAIF